MAGWCGKIKSVSLFVAQDFSGRLGVARVDGLHFRLFLVLDTENDCGPDDAGEKDETQGDIDSQLHPDPNLGPAIVVSIDFLLVEARIFRLATRNARKIILSNYHSLSAACHAQPVLHLQAVDARHVATVVFGLERILEQIAMRKALTRVGRQPVCRRVD